MKTIPTLIYVLLFALNAVAQDSQPPRGQPAQRWPMPLPVKPVYIVEYCPGLRCRPIAMDVQQAQPMQIPGYYVIKRAELMRMPCTNIRDLASIFPGIYQQRRGSELDIYAARTDGNRYIVDGMWCY